jgi:hypothetical protein
VLRVPAEACRFSRQSVVLCQADGRVISQVPLTAGPGLGDRQRPPLSTGAFARQATADHAAAAAGPLPGAGVLYWRRMRQERLRYPHDLDNLVRRWPTMGHPNPPQAFFSLYDL